MISRPALTIILPLLLATPALAQQQDAADPVFNLPQAGQPQADPNRQGPELDIYRGAPVQLPPPPVTVPTITPPPPVVQLPQPPQPSTETPPVDEQQRPAARPERPATAPSQPAPAQETAPNEPLPNVQPSLPTPESEQAAPAPQADASPQQPNDGFPWTWVLAALALVVGAIGTAWLLRRKGSDDSETLDVEAEEAESAPPKAAPQATPRRPAPAPPTGPRPWIDLTMEVRSARLSLMGATIDYVLTLHNRGDGPAEDILIRSLIANADSEQQASLRQFFAGSTGLPTHSVVSIMAGESHSVKGELRLLPDQIAPVRMEGRTLLIPLAAFDVQYRWTGEQGAPGSGRTGRAFIIGQEKSPPADRLAPFRTDLGPRQFPTPGSRATALTLTS